MISDAFNRISCGNSLWFVISVFSSVSLFAWHISAQTPIATLGGVCGVQILNIYPCPWWFDPVLGQVAEEMDRESRTTAGRETGVLMGSETAVSRFRKPLVEYLISGLEEDDKWARVLAADMLGYVGDPQAVRYLKPLLADRDRDIRVIAARSIDMIDSQQNFLLQSPPDQCAGCMIRHIAEEALLGQKIRNENARR